MLLQLLYMKHFYYVITVSIHENIFTMLLQLLYMKHFYYVITVSIYETFLLCYYKDLKQE